MKRHQDLGSSIMGAGAMAGSNELLKRLLPSIPAALHEKLQTGTAVPGKSYGKPIEEIAEFAPRDVKKIRDFAAAENVSVPILGGPESYFQRNDVLSRAGKNVMSAIGWRGEAPEELIQLNRSSLPVAFHELGHASRPALGDAWHLVHDLFETTPGKLTRTGIMGASLLPPGEDDSDARKFVHKHAPALVAATQLPGMAEEARATYRAAKGARRLGMEALPVIKELAPGFAMHAGVAAAPVIATVLAQKLIDYLRGQSGSEKHAAAPKMPAPPKASGALRASASASWHVGAYPKPKSTAPSPGGGKAKSQPTAKPPSNRAYHSDVAKSLNNPARGARASV